MNYEPNFSKKEEYFEYLDNLPLVIESFKATYNNPK